MNGKREGAGEKERKGGRELGEGRERGKKWRSVQCHSKLILCLQAPASHIGTSSCSSFSNSDAALGL